MTITAVGSINPRVLGSNKYSN